VYELFVCVTGCMIFVVCRTCALIAVLCLAKETKLKMYREGSKMGNKIRSIERVHVVALHSLACSVLRWQGSRSDTLADINIPHSPRSAVLL